jgi:hypothetical protein
MADEKIPDVVAGVQMSTRWDKAKRRIPEYSTTTSMMVTINNVYQDRFETTRALVYKSEELTDALDELAELALPIVGFNLYNYSWRVLCRDFDMKNIIPLSIDLFQGLWDLVNAEYLAGKGKKASTSGQLTQIDLLFNNFENFRPGADIPHRSNEPVALWHKLLTTGVLKVGAKPAKLNKRIGMQMIGATPRFPTAREWAQVLYDQGSTLGSPVAGFRNETRKVIRDRYKPYLSR